MTFGGKSALETKVETTFTKVGCIEVIATRFLKKVKKVLRE